MSDPRPVVGYRIWGVLPAGILRSTSYDYEYHPGVNIAVHRSHLGPPAANPLIRVVRQPGSSACAVVPAAGCQCGFWILREFEAAKRKLEDTIGISRSTAYPVMCPPPKLPRWMMGVARGWGRVIVHGDGWRCQRMQPLALLRVHGPFPDLAAQRYDVPLFDDAPALIEFAVRGTVGSHGVDFRAE